MPKYRTTASREDAPIEETNHGCARARVLHVITHIGLGGAERVCIQIIEGLRRRFEFSLYAANGIQRGDFASAMLREIEGLGIPIHLGPQLRVRRGGIVVSVLGLVRAIDIAKPDIIHLHTEVPELVYSVVAALRPALVARAIIVRTIHNSVYWTPRRALGRWCERQMSSPVIAAVSHGALRAFKELRCESGAAAPDIDPAVIYNGVHATGPARREHRKADSPIRIVFAGRFEYQKGTDLLPEILARTSLPGDTPCELTVYGHGSHKNVLEELRSRPPAGWTVRICPPVSNFDELLGDFDLLLIPARYEGLGLVAVEALLRGVPVVGTTAEGLSEVFPPDYPWVAKPGDPKSFAEMLGAALANRAAWSLAVERAWPFVRQRFDMNQMIAAYNDLYIRVYKPAGLEPVRSTESRPPVVDEPEPQQAAPGASR